MTKKVRLETSKITLKLEDEGNWRKKTKGKKSDQSGIRTHATEVTGALNQRLRPLGHLATKGMSGKQHIYKATKAVYLKEFQKEQWDKFRLTQKETL